MARLLVHVEGQTEEMFVNEVLSSDLFARGFGVVSARIIGNPRLRQRGGIRPWPSVRKELVNHLREDPKCIATTMVDFYGLPQDGDAAWPGRSQATGANAGIKASQVEGALLGSIEKEMGPGFNPRRFIPFVVMHEFEGLLFSDCGAFALAIGQPPLEVKLREIRDRFATPEEINDSAETAPSKRIAAVVPGYQEPLFGNLAAMGVGLAKIRSECPHFSHWIERLEAAAAQFGAGSERQ